MQKIETQKFKIGVKALVSEALQEMLNDPDFGLSLRAKVVQRLKDNKNQSAVSFSEIKKKYF